MIPLGAADRPAIEALLRTRPTAAMFALSNLRDHPDGSAHPNATAFWGDAAPPRRAVLGLTNRGMVLPFDTDPEAAATVLRGRSITGFAGPSGVVRPLMRALGLEGPAAGHDADEPQFQLDLAALRIPDGDGTLAPLSRDRDRAIAWRQDYNQELGLGPDAEARAAADVDGWLRADSHRFLLMAGVPVAMTGFNARLPDIVQVGGVYVPPERRRRGLARRAVALHLAEARAAGVGQATLFAASEAAAACYRGLGFARIGDYALVLRPPSAAP
ncbi:GNAT family N-acetyltransferase [uncultured Jannaschia sp.]|uniref:GNAT family N-acetyltransferase n=1 Tax=uncultured Jannaschia sp. TaxID=293347 RepID=UPI0026205B00|nr:GNAT family N-acetyltransferase [uncultured Jannaschia sp.]